MILAAGRGERMRPLTDQTPKPMLRVGDRPLIEWHLLRLAKMQNWEEVVVNTAHLPDQIEKFLQDGSAWGLRVRISREPPGALETAGGIATAKPWRDEAPFFLINGDVFIEGDLPPLVDQLAESMRLCKQAPLAHIWLVPNPAHNPGGDFYIHNGLASPLSSPSLSGPSLSGPSLSSPSLSSPSLSGPTSRNRPKSFTYSGVAILWPRLFADCIPGRPAPLGPLLRQACGQGQVSASLWPGAWVDVGTPERWQWLDQRLRSGGPLGHHE
ncbi:MAG: nucleotidyltransferase family protein [Betaproteobacteria bacterium]|nr:nucleotidyltransferase family protein [Betaproteobacteria bacterium]